MRFKILIYSLLFVSGIAIGYAVSHPIFDFSKNGQATADQLPKSNEQTLSKPLLAASMDNSPESRPQSGLSLADFVIETVTEGGITRLLSFFESGLAVEKIGPVRSARPYFVDWALGFGAALVHSGGSKEAFEEIDKFPDEIKDINEFFHGQYFFREPSQAAPHNLFTSTKSLLTLIDKKGWLAAKTKPYFPIKKDEAEATPQFKEISIDFSSPQFAVTYKYHPAANAYLRFLAAAPHIDSLTNSQIVAKNVVVIYTTSSILDEKLLTIDLETYGSGKALIFQDGTLRQARWEKLDAASALKLVDADGTLIALNQGSTWIEVVDQHGVASWK